MPENTREQRIVIASRRFHLLKFRAALDNYQHPRNIAYGELELYLPAPPVFPSPTYVLRRGDLFANPTRSNYIIDDGDSVLITYVSGWSGDGLRIFLAPFPVNGDLRPDTGRPVDMSNWMIGPRRTYHLKVEKSSQ